MLVRHRYIKELKISKVRSFKIRYTHSPTHSKTCNFIQYTDPDMYLPQRVFQESKHGWLL